MPKLYGSAKHCEDAPCKHSTVLIHFCTWYRAVSSNVACWAVAGVIWHTDTDTTWRITDNCRKNRKYSLYNTCRGSAGGKKIE